MYTKDAQNLVLTGASSAGFDDCGIADAFPVPVDRKQYEAYLAKGMNADMGYLRDTTDQRFDPGLLLPGVHSVVVCVAAYNSPLPGYQARPADRAFISRYAWGQDYHRVVKERLVAMINMIEPVLGHSWLPFVDTGPVFEKAYAQKAGLGFIGKNTLLIHPIWGSFVFLGVILTDMHLRPTTSQRPQHACGSCTKCVDACPSGALKPFSLDATRCIGHINNMYSGDLVGVDFHANLFGCDTCQDACPYNKKAAFKHGSPFLPEHEYNRFPRPQQVLNLSNKGIKRAFHGTPVAIQRPRRLKQIAGIIDDQLRR